MAHFKVSDIDALISRGAGSADVLVQIRRAMQSGEVISATEYAYVQNLIEEHAGPRPAEQQAEKLAAQLRPEPGRFSGRRVDPGEEKKRRGRRGRGAARRARRILSRRKIIVFALIVLAVAAAATYGAYTARAPGGLPAATAPPDPPPPPLGAGVMLDTDQDSYSSGEIILVSGRAQAGASVGLELGAAGAVLWEEEITAGGDGTYSTIVIAGGPGWSAGSTYVVTATSASGIHTAEFAFAAE